MQRAGSRKRGGSEVERQLVDRFVCPRCGQSEARAETLSLKGVGWGLALGIARTFYCFISCTHCGLTEVYDPRLLRDLDGPGPQGL